MAFAYVAARAALVPLVHDEANSFFHYVHSGPWLPFHGKWDAANHVLAMAAGSLCDRLFGPSALSLRAFALLSYVLFAWCSWQVSRTIRDRTLRWTCWAGLLGMPFMIEFFALFRGYGPSFALLLLSLLALHRFLASDRHGPLFVASGAMGAAVMANLSLLPLWALVMGILVVWVARASTMTTAPAPSQRPGRLLPMRLLGLALGLAPGLWMVAFSMGLRERGLLYYGSDRGLLLGSLASIRERLVPDLPDAAGLVLCIAVVAVVGLALGQVIRTRSVRDHGLFILVCTLLLGEVVARTVLGEVFGVLYPKDRAILHLFPLLLTALVQAFDVLSLRRPMLRWASLPLWLLPAYTLWDANLHRTIQWPEESISEPIQQAVRDQQEALDRGLLIAGASPLAVIWEHGLLTKYPDLPTLFAGHPPPRWADLVLADARKPDEWQEDFEVLLGPEASGQWLLRPKVPAHHRLLVESTLLIPPTTNEFVELFADTLTSAAGAGLLVDLEAAFQASVGARGECLLVVQVAAPGSDHRFYRSIPLHHLWNGNNARSIRATMAVEPPPQGDERLSVYVWNIAGQAVEVRSGRLRLYAVEQADTSASTP